MKTRIMTALMLLIICVPLLILGGTLFNLLVLVVGVMGLKEMIDIRDSKILSTTYNEKSLHLRLFIYLVVQYDDR